MIFRVNSKKNIGYLLLIATSIGIVFAVASPKVLSPADARSDYCKQFPQDSACQKDSGRYLDQNYKCEEQARKDGVATPEEIQKCRSK